MVEEKGGRERENLSPSFYGGQHLSKFRIIVRKDKNRTLKELHE